MSTVIRIEDEPVPTRLDCLWHAVRNTIAPFDVQPDVEPDFSSLIVTGSTGPLGVTAVSGHRSRPRVLRV